MFSDEQNKIVIPKKEDTSQNTGTKKFTFSLSYETKRLLLIIISALLVLGLIFALTCSLLNKKQAPIETPQELEEEPVEIEEPGTLPDFSSDNGESIDLGADINLDSKDIEYLSFSDFYKSPELDFKPSYIDYQLPLNIKIDGLNYYSLSRKINLDPVLDDLNNYGFAVIDNPWSNEANDFYSLSRLLADKQISLFISSDFIIYYFQNMLKQVYKEIEEGIFYDNLWAINNELFLLAKNRYEARLALLGNQNNPMLEGERMVTAFFAVALELLKPDEQQVASKGALEDKSMFSEGEAEKFSFIAPTYLREDVAKEVQLIKAAKTTEKSPNLFYQRDYQDFKIPKEYQADAKLKNFYLSSVWLNSLFPLLSQSDDCPECLLDEEDWRISQIASSLIASDISSSNKLKLQWAIIYKLMAYFQGLRDELDYVNLRDSLAEIFSEDYDLAELLGDYQPDSFSNLEKLQTKLLDYNFSALRGAYDKSNPDNLSKLGFRVLTGNYWPNDYIFQNLTWPKVGEYQGRAFGASNITGCLSNQQLYRCNGYSLDIINLIRPLAEKESYQENSNYLNFQPALNHLMQELNQSNIWHTSNYWTTLSLMKTLLHNQLELPAFSQSQAWNDQKIKSAGSAWINLQLPVDDFSLRPSFEGNGIDGLLNYDENIYVEPNLELIAELKAINDSIFDTFSVLGLNKEANLAFQGIRKIRADLDMLTKVIEQELKGERLDSDIVEELKEFASRYQVAKKTTSEKTLAISFPEARRNLNLDLSKLKLMTLVYPLQGQNIIVVGPVWNYQEARR